MYWKDYGNPFFSVGSNGDELTDEGLSCMCVASSNGCYMPDPPCVNNPSIGTVCGPWAITEPYWVDGGRLGGSKYQIKNAWTYFCFPFCTN